MVNVGKWAFIIGVIIAVISGFWTVPAVTLVMVILGLLVGFLNVTGEETQIYLVASVALMIIGATLLNQTVLSTLTSVLGDWLQSVLTNFVAFVTASALVVALRAIIVLGQSE
ncbi:hypothetical protein J7K05_02465 [bacterium]|nr:hypothetical protein [bacterium]